MKEVIEEELHKEDIKEPVLNENKIIEPVVNETTQREAKPINNMWSDVAELMQNDPSITKIYGKRMRKTITKFE